LLKEHKKNHNVVPTERPQRGCALTPQDSGQDFFYYVNKQDEDEAFESLGYNPRCFGTNQEDDFRVNKFW